jgi:hypothetical protein
MDRETDARPTRDEKRDTKDERGITLTRALRSHQLWLTLTYFGLLGLMARGLAG